MSDYERLRPKLRDDIAFSPGEVKGARTVFYAKDRFTGQFYRVGEREHFLLSRMDGRRTLAEIGGEYEAQFGRRLDGRSWDGLFKLMRERQMLEGWADEAGLEELKRRARENRRREGRGWLYRRFPLVNPDALLARLLPRVRFMFRPSFVAAGLAAIVAVEAFVLLNLGEIRGAAWEARSQPHSWALFVGLLLLLSAFHELGHGLACKHYGGVVNEMGVVWRYLYFFPYCKLDHVILFRERRHRVYVAAAGTYVGLLLLAPFALAWWWAPPQSVAHAVSAKVLTVYNFVTLLNLIPFVQLDGYFMLSHALGMTELRQESHRFLLRALEGRLLGAGAGVAGYGRREQLIYSVYGVMSLLTAACFIALVATLWYRLAAGRFGNNAWLFVAGIVLLIVLRRVGHRAVNKLIRRWHSPVPSGPVATPK